MKRSMKRLALIALTLALALAFAACQPAGGTATEAPATTQPTTAPTAGAGPTPEPEVVVLSTSAALDNMGWFLMYIRNNLYIELQSMGGTLDTWLASGELPALVSIWDKQQCINAATSGNLLCFDDYQDQLPNLYGSDGYFQYAIQYCRDYLSGDLNRCYVIPLTVGAQDYINYDPQLRWDIYEMAGSPRIETLEDYLPAMQAMVEAYPRTESGEKTYGFSLFPSWDGNTMGNAGYIATLYGIDVEYVCSLLQVPADGNGEIIPILDDSSVYKRVLRLFFNANQLGLLDPDSATQTWDNIVAKWNAGRIMFSPWEWSSNGFNTTENVAAGIGYASVWPEDAQMIIYPDQWTGSTWYQAAGANVASDPDVLAATLRFYDFYYSYDGMDLVYNGPEGVLWEDKGNGTRALTDEGYNVVSNGLQMPMSGGGVLDCLMSSFFNAPSFSKYTISPTWGEEMYYGYWDDTELRNNQTALRVDWAEAHDGIPEILPYAKENGMTIKMTQAVYMCAAPSEDLKMIISAIGAVVKPASWQMVFASSEEEFEAIWDRAQADADSLGMDQVLAYYQAEFASALAEVANYSPAS